MSYDWKKMWETFSENSEKKFPTFFGNFPEISPKFPPEISPEIPLEKLQFF